MDEFKSDSETEVDEYQRIREYYDRRKAFMNKLKTQQNNSQLLTIYGELLDDDVEFNQVIRDLMTDLSKWDEVYQEYVIEPMNEELDELNAERTSPIRTRSSYRLEG